MSKPVVALLVVLGLGAVAWWYLRKQGAAAPLETAQSPDACGGGVFGTIGAFVKSHVDRKNAVAPLVASAYVKAPPAQLAPLTNLAGKLDISAPVEKWVGDKVGNALCSVSFPSIGAIVGTAGTTIKNTTVAGGTFGAEQLKAGTVTPVRDVYNAGSALVHGDVVGAGRSIVSSVVDGPKAAYNSTKSLISKLNPF